MRFRLALVFILCGLATWQAQASGLRLRLSKSSVVVTGEAVGFSRGAPGYLWQKDSTSGTRKLYETTYIDIRVSRYIKGSGPDTLRVAFARTLPAKRGDLLAPYKLQPGSKGVFFVQSPQPDGSFLESAVSWGFRWSVEGAALASLDMVGGQGYISLENLEFTPSPNPILCLADLFARNAALRNSSRPLYIACLEDLTPDQRNNFGMGNEQETPGDDAKMDLDWARNQLPEILPVSNPTDQLNDDAIQVIWGVREKVSRFLDEYLAQPEDSLAGNMPVMDTPGQLIRVLPRLHGSSLRGAILSLAAAPHADRVAILHAITPFIGKEGKYVDLAVMEASANMFGKPAWSPGAALEAHSDPTPVLNQIRAFDTALRIVGS